MSFLRILSPAKVNLFLKVVRRRDDGYHQIRSLIQPIDIFDEILISVEKGTGIELKSSGIRVPVDESNLAVRAAKAYLESSGIDKKIWIELKKVIPTGAGLGGGSSNAAAVLVGLNRLLGKADDGEMIEIAGKLGSDVSFFIHSVTSMVEGTGEKIRFLRDFPFFHYIVLFPRIHLSTKSVYEKWDEQNSGNSEYLDTAKLVERFKSDKDLPLFNDLEEPAFSMHLGMEAFKKIFYSLGAKNVLMSGSGSSFFAVFRTEKEASEVYEYLRVSNENDVFLAKGIKGWHFVLE